MARVEVVVVLNNCSDDSSSVAEKFDFVQTVVSTSTSFSLARNEGAEAALADFLVFIDDDTTTNRPFLDEIVKIFEKTDVGMIAGRIEPKFDVSPPLWVTRLQERRNGLSLFSPEPSSKMGDSDTEDFGVGGACGPMLIVRKKVLVEAGGFPADTLGVETDDGDFGFTKLYVGPGDFGLSKSCEQLGYKIRYSPSIGLSHHIPEIRMRPEFWGSRFFGEGMYKAQWRLQSGQKYEGLRVMGGLFSYRFLRGYGFRMAGEPSHIDVDLAELIGDMATTAILKKQTELASKIWTFAEKGLVADDLRELLDEGSFRAFLEIANHDWSSLHYPRWLGSLQSALTRALFCDLRATGLLGLLLALTTFRCLSRIPIFRWNLRFRADH